MHHNWIDFFVGLCIGTGAMFFQSVYTMNKHIKKWRCGSGNPDLLHRGEAK